MEVSGVTAASVVTVTTPVASLDESSSFVGYGSLGKLGDLGFTFAASRKVSVNSLALAQSISMHPPVNHDGKVCSIRVCVACVFLVTFEFFHQSYAFAKYAVNKKFERLSGSVALNDATPADKLRAQGSAVSFGKLRSCLSSLSEISPLYPGHVFCDWRWASTMGIQTNVGPWSTDLSACNDC